MHCSASVRTSDIHFALQHLHMDLLAAGAGAGVAAGFGAPMSGVLFAVETMLLIPAARRTAAPPEAPSTPDDDDGGLQMASILVACVFAAMVSQAGLGKEPAFAVPDSVAFQLFELPLFVAVGLLCGGASALLASASRSTEKSFASLRTSGLPAVVMPPLGGLACGSLALLCPEITYQGFENVNALLQLTESPFSGYSAASLVAVILVKVVATASCRGSGLVGGVYAPAIFIGAAVGGAFWLSAAGGGSSIAEFGLSLSSPEMYSLVGAASMLAAFCRVPLTATLLLFELTQDYTVILPTLAAVGLARWSAAVAGRYLRSLDRVYT
jgi:H+/Cl- antiporter ClcA